MAKRNLVAVSENVEGQTVAPRGPTVNFVKRENGPERLECEAEVVFGSEAGPLAGFKLVGFSLWRSAEGEVYVTFPSRAFGAGSDRRYFDYMRPADGGDMAVVKEFKRWVVEQWLAWEAAERKA